VAADDFVGGTWDVMKVRVEISEDFPDPLLERRGRKSFVAAAVEANRRVIADAQDEIFHVLQKEIVIVRLGTVPGIGKPEVLPDYDSVPIAGFVKGIVADLADPVANHGEVHFAVVADRDIVFAGAIAEHRLAKAPVAATRNESPTIDPDS
jgi:hypothetical protein